MKAEDSKRRNWRSQSCVLLQLSRALVFQAEPTLLLRLLLSLEDLEAQLLDFFSVAPSDNLDRFAAEGK